MFAVKTRWQKAVAPTALAALVSMMLAGTGCGRDKVTTVQATLAPSGDNLNFGDVILGGVEEAMALPHTPIDRYLPIDQDQHVRAIDSQRAVPCVDTAQHSAAAVAHFEAAVFKSGQ